MAVFTAVYTLGGQDFLRLLTDEETVVEASADYLPWAALLPVCGVAAFVWDGVFIGTTKSREMLISSLVAALLFFGCFYALTLLARIPVNHALWLSYLLFLLMRGVVQTLYYPRLFLREKPSV